ncbi:MAG: MltA domain-containing protein, partial [Alphaproteobacteria bacterium]|nr:MltA domain-containing protein [Alphaproteobacteria bacterium]
MVRYALMGILLLLGACDTGLIRHKNKVYLEKVSYSNLPGWDKDDTRHAFKSFLNSCQKIKTTSTCSQDSAIYLDCGAMKDICEKAPQQSLSLSETKGFFEKYFYPYKISDPQTGEIGTFTGYYQPFFKGSRARTSYFSAPIYSHPTDLTNGSTYLTRKQIEDSGLNGRANVLYWTHPVDLFDLQTQGSGVLQLENGQQVQVGYAGNNGHEFQSVTTEIKKRGYSPSFTAQGVLGWLKQQNPQIAREIMQTNPRYIFYQENSEGPFGALGVVLTPQRSLAVDESYIPLGAPIFLSTTAQGHPFQKLMMTQD